MLEQAHGFLNADATDRLALGGVLLEALRSQVAPSEHVGEATAADYVLVPFFRDGVGSPAYVRRLCAERPELALVVLAGKSEISAEEAIDVMKAGAFDLVLKPIPERSLAARIAAAAAEGRRRRERLETRLAAQERLERLTRREREVAEELVEGATNKLAARRLNLSPRTVEFYRARIFEKLEIASVAQLTRVALTAEAA